jgi:hypothetical protein
MNRADDLPQCRDDYGSSWEDSQRYVRDQESAQCTMSSSEETLGFRLARDGGQRSFRGGAWRFSSAVAGEATERDANAPFHGAFIGFRLTWDRT